jgi:hypothetical protein
MSDTGPGIQTFEQAGAAAAADTGVADPSGGAPAGGENPVGAPPGSPVGQPAAPPAGDDGLTPGQRQRYEAENYKYRQQLAEAQQYVQAFDGWHPDDAAVIRQLLQLQQTNPEAAADGFFQIAASLKEAQRQAAAAPPPPAATMADIERFFAQKEEQQAISGQVMTIQQEAAQLGFPPGTPGYAVLLQHATAHYGNDLQAAAASLQKAKEEMTKAAIADYLKDKEGQAMGAPPIAPEGAAGVPAPNQIKTFEEANAMARANLA